MKKVCKIRCYPNKTQERKIDQILGACRFVMNKMIEFNNKSYAEDRHFISGYDFSIIINHLKKENPDFMWLDDVSSKAIKDAIMVQEKAYKNFFRKIKQGIKVSSPRFKSRKRLTKESFFFVKNNVHFDTGKKHRITIPILKSIRINEREYLPSESSISSGRVIKEGDKYYLMFIYDTEVKVQKSSGIGYGIDVGVKSYVTGADTDGEAFSVKHFKDLEKYQMLDTKIKKLQQIISRKAEINYNFKYNYWLDKHPGEVLNDKYKNIMKGESYNTSNIQCLRKKVNVLYGKLKNIRKDFIDKLVYKLVAIAKPKFIAIEDLQVSKMLQNDSSHTLHKYIQESGFYYFRQQLERKCREYSVELRIADKYFASSKKCCLCGNKKKDLKLSDRTYKCDDCGLEIDRDLNAALNLVNLKKYSIV